MNIRDYWLLKLPEVRRQSPATGKLVEHLLINDSSNSRSVLLEINKIKENRLVEELTSNNEVSSEKVKNSLKAVFSQTSKNMSQNESPSKVIDQIVSDVEDIREENGVGSKLYITESKNYSKFFDDYKSLFTFAGFKSYWNRASIMQKINTVALTTLSIAIAIYFGVLVYKRYRDKGHKIVGVILGVLAGLILQSVIAVVMDGLIILIHYLINLFKKK